MKRKNFPERRRQRRLGALKRLDNRWDLTKLPVAIEKEMTALEQRTARNLRDVRTKKRRDGKTGS